MEANTPEYRMLTDTLGIFQEGSATTISPDQGILMIEGWLNALRGDGNASRITSELGELRTALRAQPINNDRIRDILSELASHTNRVTNDSTIDGQTSQQLKQLATALFNFSSQF